MIPDIELTLNQTIIAVVAVMYLIPAFAVTLMAGLYGR